MKCIFEIVPIIPVMMIYVYIINIYESVRPGIYWWMFALFLMAMLSIQSVSNLVALLVTNVGGGQRAGSQMIMLIVCSITYIFLMNSLSNFYNPLDTVHYFYQIIAYFNTSRWLHEALILLQYGFGRCGKKEIQAILYIMHIYHDEYFYKCVTMLFANMLLYRTLALLVLLAKSNPMKNRRKRAEQILQYHQKYLEHTPINTIIPGLTTDLHFSIKQIKDIQNDNHPTSRQPKCQA